MSFPPVDTDERLAVWQAGSSGVDWLDELGAQGAAARTRRGGYPDSYRIRAKAVRARIEEGLPDENKTWILSADSVIVSDRYLGRRSVDHDAIARCDPDEWLLIQAWDES